MEIHSVDSTELILGWEINSDSSMQGMQRHWVQFRNILLEEFFVFP